MSRILFQEYPDYFYKITALFKDGHINFDKKIKPFLKRSIRDQLPRLERSHLANEFRTYNKTQQLINLNEDRYKERTQDEVKEFVINSKLMQCTFLFESNLTGLIKGWNKISGEKLASLERDALKSWLFMSKLKEEQLNLILRINPYLEIIEDSFDWTIEMKRHINANLINSLNETLGLAYIPQLFFNGYQEIVIDELDFNILVLLQQPIPFKTLLSGLRTLFVNKGNGENEGNIYELAVIKLKKLIIKKCVLLKN